MHSSCRYANRHECQQDRRDLPSKSSLNHFEEFRDRKLHETPSIVGLRDTIWPRSQCGRAFQPFRAGTRNAQVRSFKSPRRLYLQLSTKLVRNSTPTLLPAGRAVLAVE
jgi:hypothetical protein